MKSLLPILLIFIHSVYAQDIRDKVQSADQDKNQTIEPGRHIYGVPWGASEDELIQAEGKPNGYLSLTPSKSAMIYGRSHAYIFVSGKLQELRITSQIVDWMLSNQTMSEFRMSSYNWTLSNGVHARMTMEEAKELLGSELKETEIDVYFDLNDHRIKLNIVTYSSIGEERKKRIDGIYITPNKG